MKFISLIFNIGKVVKALREGQVLLWVCDRFCLVPPDKAFIYNLVKDRIEFNSSEDFEKWYEKVSYTHESTGEPSIMIYYRYNETDKMPLLWY